MPYNYQATIFISHCQQQTTSQNDSSASRYPLLLRPDMTQNGGNTHYSLRLSQRMYNRNTLFRHDANRKPTQPTKGDHRYSLPLKPTTQNTTPAIKRHITRLQNICNRDNARQNSSYYRTSRTRTTSLLHSDQHTMSKSQPPAYRGKSLRAISRNTKNLL